MGMQVVTFTVMGAAFPILPDRPILARPLVAVLNVRVHPSRVNVYQS